MSDSSTIYWNLYNNPTLTTICSKDGNVIINIIRDHLNQIATGKCPTDNDILIETEGPIGTGKTTLVNKIAEEFPVEFKSKQITIFSETAMDHPNELIEFYSDMKKNAYSFEMLNLQHYKTQLDQVHFNKDAPKRSSKSGYTPKIYIMDRGLISIYTFSLLLHKDKLLSHEDLVKLYLEFIKLKNFDKTSYLIYIDNNAKTLLERIAKRGRECEKGITKKYLQDYIDISMNIGLIKDSDDIARMKRRTQ